MSFVLQLRHHIKHSKFSLVKEGQDWRHEFDTLEEAMRFAANLVSGRLAFIEVDDAGAIISESTIETAAFRSSAQEGADA